MATNNAANYKPSQYNIQVGGASGTLSNVAPSATSGVPVISQGSSANPTFGTAVVAGGGTGVTSATAYAPIVGGTTSTGAFQSADTGIGTSGFVLTSNGASAVPSWQASGSTITLEGDTGGPITGTSFVLDGGSTGLSFDGTTSPDTFTLSFAGITANGGTVSLATDATTSTINIGTGAGVKTSTFGSNNSTSSTTLRSGSGALSITSANGALTMNSGTGAINIGTDATSKNITIGSSTGTTNVGITAGSGGMVLATTDADAYINTGAGALYLGIDGSGKGVVVGSTGGAASTFMQSGSGELRVYSTNGPVNMYSGTGVINISGDAAATAVNVGAGAAAKTVTMGSTTSGSTSVIQAPAGGITLTGVAGTSVSNLNYVTINSSTGQLGSTANTGSAQTSFTPALQFGGASTGITYSIQTGYYSRVGNIVYYSLYLALSAVGSATGDATISGLPITSANISNLTYAGAVVAGSLTYTGTSICAFVQQNATVLSLVQMSSTFPFSSLSNTNFSSSSVIEVTGFYFV